MVDIATEVWNNAEVSLIKIDKNDNENKKLFTLLCISDSKKRWVGKNH